MPSNDELCHFVLSPGYVDFHLLQDRFPDQFLQQGLLPDIIGVLIFLIYKQFIFFIK